MPKITILGYRKCKNEDFFEASFVENLTKQINDKTGYDYPVDYIKDVVAWYFAEGKNPCLDSVKSIIHKINHGITFHKEDEEILIQLSVEDWLTLESVRYCARKAWGEEFQSIL